jgi:hypothetical protein
LNLEPLAATYSPEQAREATMARHWRKASYQRTLWFNAFIGWAIGASVVLATLVFIARHVYI